jgi:peroxiredoxin Q/BCP
VQVEQAGILVIGVSQDDAASHASFRKNERLNYPLAADVDGGLCTVFGACRGFQAGGFNLYQRVAFLVAADGAVLGTWSLNGPDEQVHAALDAALEIMRAGALAR